MKITRSYRSFESWLKLIGWISVAATFFIMLILTIDALMTKFFSKPIPGTAELVAVVNVLVVWTITSYVQLEMGQQRVELYKHLFGTIGQSLIDIISNTIGLIVVSFLCWRTYKYTEYLFISDERVRGQLNFNLWPFSAAMTIALLFLALALIVSIVRTIKTIDLR